MTSFVASVVFLRIQDFPIRPASEQARMRAQLEAVVAVTTAELAPKSRIVLDAADGLVVAVLADPKGALRVAERALAAAIAGLPLCAGINHGALRLLGVFAAAFPLVSQPTTAAESGPAGRAAPSNGGPKLKPS